MERSEEAIFVRESSMKGGDEDDGQDSRQGRWLSLGWMKL